MSEQEEFEFRHRLEQEQVSPEMGGSPPLGFVMDQVSSMAPWNKANKFLKEDVAGGIAEAGGYLGAKAESAGYPELGKDIERKGIAVGGLVGLSPEILSAYVGLKGIYNSQNPTIKGLVNTPQELSPQYTAQNKAVGLSNRPPEQSGGLKFPNPYGQTMTNKPPVAIQTETSLPSNLRGAEALPETTPLKYPKDPATLINTIDKRATQFGENLNAQELSDYKRLLDQNIGDPNKIPKYIDGKKNPLYAQASEMRKRVVGILNRFVEKGLEGAELPSGTATTRAGLDKAYGVASKLQAGTKKVGKYAVGGVLGVAGTSALASFISKVTGKQ